VRIKIEDRVKEFIRELPEKDRRVIGEHIERLSKHPSATGNIKKLRTCKPRWRMHISLKYTLFYYVESDMVWIDKIMTIEQAHKKYGKI
jgi:mRNA-degrading endonuclease RelE of RelBE toxin-antitoxin system